MEIIAHDTVYRCRKGCSECCTIKLEISPIEAAEISEKTKIPANTFIDYTSGMGSLNVAKKWNSEGVSECFFLEKGRCKINDYKPFICKLYPLGLRLSYGGKDIVCEPVDTARKSCDECIDKEFEERILKADEIKKIAEKIMKGRATMTKLNKDINEGRLIDKAVKIYKEMSLEEAVVLMKEKYGDWLEYNVSF